MKKHILLKLLFLSVLAGNFNFSILAVGENDYEIPDYTIDAKGLPGFDGSEKSSQDVPFYDNSGNNLNNNTGNNSGNNLQDNGGDTCSGQQNLNSDDSSFDNDYGDDQGLISKIKNKLPSVSKKLIRKVVRTVLIVGAAGLTTFFGYKFAKIVTANFKKIVGAVSTSAAIAGVCFLYLKYNNSQTDEI